MTELAAFFLYAFAALASGMAAIAVARHRGSDRPDRPAAVLALALTATWAAANCALGADHRLVGMAEIARNLAWIFVLFRIFAADGRQETMGVVRPLIVCIALVEALQLPIALVAEGLARGEGVAGGAGETSALLRMLVGIGALVLVHNLYVGAAEATRRLLAWNAAGMALLWGFFLNYHTVTFLTGATMGELHVMRAVAVGAAAPIFALGYTKASADLRFRPSRPVAFSVVSLVLIAAYLIAMVALSRWVAGISGDLARITQVGFLLTAAGLALLWLPSRRLRGWIRVTALKHLFRHRFDYRSEWIRFTHTMGRASEREASLHDRSIRSLADITGSRAGLLFLPEADGGMGLAANWGWSGADLPTECISDDLLSLLEREQLIIDCDAARAGEDHAGERTLLPDWLIEDTRSWAGVPLLHHARLVGVVVLARPEIDRRLDWEDFDLLSIAGLQVASYLAEEAGQRTLEEAARFDEFNRRMAFVMHDIKNLSSQMSLLLRNAERHADNPEFRRDMLVTLRSSAEKLNTLLGRLGRYGTQRSDAERSEEFDLAALAGELADRFRHQHPMLLGAAGPCRVVGVREALDKALAHLILNAVEAGEPDSPVTLEVASDGLVASIAVIDTGRGMTPAFLRQHLFRPFLSTKDGGFGIGACEARDLVRGMGGRLEVESREGLGSRFTVFLPMAEAARLRQAQITHENRSRAA